MCRLVRTCSIVQVGRPAGASCRRYAGVPWTLLKGRTSLLCGGPQMICGRGQSTVEAAGRIVFVKIDFVDVRKWGCRCAGRDVVPGRFAAVDGLRFCAEEILSGGAAGAWGHGAGTRLGSPPLPCCCQCQRQELLSAENSLVRLPTPAKAVLPALPTVQAWPVISSASSKALWRFTRGLEKASTSLAAASNRQETRDDTFCAATSSQFPTTTLPPLATVHPLQHWRQQT